MIIFQRVFKLQVIKRDITKKVIKRELSFLYATHRHDLFYVTVKYHQTIPNGIQVIERARKCLRTDGRQAHRYMPRTFWSGDNNASSVLQDDIRDFIAGLTVFLYCQKLFLAVIEF